MSIATPTYRNENPQGTKTRRKVSVFLLNGNGSHSHCHSAGLDCPYHDLFDDFVHSEISSLMSLGWNRDLESSATHRRDFSRRHKLR